MGEITLLKSGVVIWREILQGILRCELSEEARIIWIGCWKREKDYAVSYPTVKGPEEIYLVRRAE